MLEEERDDCVDEVDKRLQLDIVDADVLTVEQSLVDGARLESQVAHVLVSPAAEIAIRALLVDASIRRQSVLERIDTILVGVCHTQHRQDVGERAGVVALD